MKIIDKLISDCIINKDDCSDKVLYTICKECWNREVIFNSHFYLIIEF